MPKQPAFPGLRNAMKKKVTRRGQFLAEMLAVLLALIAPHDSKAGLKGGRGPMVRCEFALARVPARRGCQRLVQLARSARSDRRAGFDAREAMNARVSASEGWLRVAMSRHATRNEPRQTVANTHAITIAWRSRTKMARLGGAENIGPERAKTASATPIPVRRGRVRSIENLGNFQAQRDRERAIRCHGGGEGGIRTHGGLAPTTVFETAPIDRSGTSPRSLRVLVDPFHSFKVEIDMCRRACCKTPAAAGHDDAVSDRGVGSG